ncbi:MAG: rhodanese-like domain-containing protein [Gammaproteobacteria bacterium]
MDTSRLLEFVANHWILSGAFVTLSALIILNELRQRLYGVTQLGAHDATRLMNTDEAVILDVREDSEYKQGHIASALHIPLGQLGQRLKELDKHRGHTLVTYCHTGGRASKAAALLRKQGFEDIRTLAGGIVAWQNANLPLTKK